MSQKIKIHLGCGKRDWPGWYNVDIVNYPHVHHKDITKLPFPNDSCDLLYASHLICYFDRDEIIPILKEWRRVLKPNGYLRLAVPDMRIMAMLYFYKKFDLESFLGPIFGKISDGNNNFFYHKTGYDFHSLKEILVKSGFHDIHRYNWRKTEHSSFDDQSQAYLPKMDKDNGVLISLNVQCTKEKLGLIRHNMTKTPTYNSWQAMIRRCHDKKFVGYKHYKSRNIVIDDSSWLDFHNFFNEMGERPSWATLDRIDNNKGYSFKNCRWANDLEQQNNKASNFKKIIDLD